VIGVDPQWKLRSDLAHIVDGKHATLPDLVLDAEVHVHHARRLVTGRQHAAEIRYAVRQGVDVRTARRGRLCGGELRLQVLNQRGDRHNRLPANAGRDVNPIH
jgi:hypothetical protein